MIIKRKILYTPTNKYRTLHIYLPDNYETSDCQYPVMYYFDGHNLFSDADATYGKSWGLKTFLEHWGKEMIIVGIECGHEGRERLSEYCPYNYKGTFWCDLEGIGEQTMEWIVNELKPVIDHDYRTYYFREATGIAGSSMGGLMALYASIRFNRWFSKAACLSSAIGPGMNELQRDIADCYMDPDTKVYLSWGTEEAGGTASDPKDDWISDTARRNITISSLLKDKQVQTSLFCQRFGHHCEADWEKQVPEFMDYLWMR